MAQTVGKSTHRLTQFLLLPEVLFLPEPLLGQLKMGGKLVIPVGEEEKSQNLIRITHTKNGFQSEDFGKCSFVPLIGEHGW